MMSSALTVVLIHLQLAVSQRSLCCDSFLFTDPYFSTL